MEIFTKSSGEHFQGLDGKKEEILKKLQSLEIEFVQKLREALPKELEMVGLQLQPLTYNFLPISVDQITEEVEKVLKVKNSCKIISQEFGKITFRDPGGEEHQIKKEDGVFYYSRHGELWEKFEIEDVDENVFLKIPANPDLQRVTISELVPQTFSLKDYLELELGQTKKEKNKRLDQEFEALEAL